jgi:adenosylhomocysteine nucleosidase
MTGTSPIGAVIAMEVELQHLLAQGHIKQESKQGPWREVRLQIGEHEVMAVLCGIGMVNAAAATEYLIGAHRPRIIVNSGCTGAHVAELLPGDVVIGTSVIYHAAMQILATGEERYTGFAFETITREINTPALPTDVELVDLAQRVAKSTRLPDWPADLDWPASQPRRSPRIVSGPVASADIWTQSIPRLDILRERHETLCEDMEAAAIGQIAARHEIPYLTIKDISNNERHAQTDLVGELAGFPMHEAGHRAAILLGRIIAAIPAEFDAEAR